MATSANRDDGADGIADPADILAGVPHLSSDSSKIFRIPISTRIDPAGFLHKHAMGVTVPPKLVARADTVIE